MTVTNPTYGGAPYRKPEGCPCCKGLPVLDPRREMCDACWNRAIRLMVCDHSRGAS